MSVCPMPEPARQGCTRVARTRQPDPLRITNAELHGAWGLTIEWNDGHATGIFPFELLRRWRDGESPPGRDAGPGTGVKP